MRNGQFGRSRLMGPAALVGAIAMVLGCSSDEGSGDGGSSSSSSSSSGGGVGETGGSGGTGGISETGGTAGTGGASTAGTGGASTAGTGGASTAGTGGASTAGPILFEDDLESDPSNWMCRDSAEGTTNSLTNWALPACGWTDGFGAEFRMGPGRNGGNALYSYKRSGVPNGYRSESNNWLTGDDVYQEIYHRWYMKVPPASEYDKTIPHGFKFWRYITRENGYSNPPEIYLNAAPTGGTFAGRNLALLMTVGPSAGVFALKPISEFNDREWHSHEVRIKVNSNGAADGEFDYWFDGTLTASHRNLQISSAATDLAIHRFGVGIGNTSDSDWYQSEWSAIAFDDVVVSTSYIGLD